MFESESTSLPFKAEEDSASRDANGCNFFANHTLMLKKTIDHTAMIAPSQKLPRPAKIMYQKIPIKSGTNLHNMFSKILSIPSTTLAILLVSDPAKRLLK